MIGSKEDIIIAMKRQARPDLAGLCKWVSPGQTMHPLEDTKRKRLPFKVSSWS